MINLSCNECGISSGCNCNPTPKYIPRDEKKRKEEWEQWIIQEDNKY